jgi:hypothetical protein
MTSAVNIAARRCRCRRCYRRRGSLASLSVTVCLDFPGFGVEHLWDGYQLTTADLTVVWIMLACSSRSAPRCCAPQHTVLGALSPMDISLGQCERHSQQGWETSIV